MQVGFDYHENLDEAKVDRVFTNAVFWVVTRTNDCFY